MKTSLCQKSHGPYNLDLSRSMCTERAESNPVLYWVLTGLVLSGLWPVSTAGADTHGRLLFLESIFSHLNLQ